MPTFSRNRLFKSAGLLFAASIVVILLAASPSLAADEAYFTGDNITLHLLLESNENVPAQLQLMIYNPENMLLGRATHNFTLETGKNQVDFTIPFYTDMDGLHYLRYDIFAELEGGQTLVQSSTRYFDGEVNDPPVIKLLSPKNGGVYPPGEEIEFSASVLDPEGQKTSVTWTSNVSGTIGSGTSFSRALEPAGVHRITVSAEDALGVVSSRSITISVIEDDGDGTEDDTGDDTEDETGAYDGDTIISSSRHGTGFATIILKDSTGEGEKTDLSEGSKPIFPEQKPGEEESGTQNVPGGEAEKEKTRGLPGFELCFTAVGFLLAVGFTGRKKN